MENTLYDIMNWPEIEAVVYSECSNPKALLGARVIEEGVLIQAFFPNAQSVRVHNIRSNKFFEMGKYDDAGFYAVILPFKRIPAYTYEVTYDNGVTQELYDPYSFDSQFTDEDLKRFASGIHYEIYDKLGAHPMVLNGVKGVNFAVWAPNAMRVSVVGDFNLWDGRRHQMQKLGDSGVYEIFIPELDSGEFYRYEIKFKSREPALKSDPYGNYCEVRPARASVVYDINNFDWTDKAWLEERDKKNFDAEPVSIYEVHLGSWKKPEDGEREFYNYRELAVELASYVKSMGYTHIELMPIMEHPLDASWGYQVTGYYAPTSRYGTPDDFMFFMNYMHEKGIGVILDWVPAHFPKDRHALADFDGACLYEHPDPRRGEHPHWGTLIFDYGRPQVSNFLIANALFWAEKYHIDGIRMDAVASMLYLDYGKNEGEWLPNIYGGKENLEALEMLKHLNSIMKKRLPGVMLIAEESTAWPNITGPVENGAVGFDLKWNMGWMNDFLGYMQTEPYVRRYHYNELTFSMVYAYSEKFILVLSHDEVVHGKGSMAGKMPGATFELKFANLRAAYLFMMTHPGKKLLFMGQDFGQMDEWNENDGLQWNLLKYDLHSNMQKFMKAANKLYNENPALYELDFSPEGFEWIDCTNAEENIAVFIRKSVKKEETLLVVCNFEQIYHEKYDVGVPYAGKYKEIINSDSKAFGGEGLVNSRMKKSVKKEASQRENSINIKIAPLSVSVFSFVPYTGEELKAIKEAEEKKAAPKAGKNTSGRKRTVKTVKKASAADVNISENKTFEKAVAETKEAKPLETAVKKSQPVKTKAAEPKPVKAETAEPKPVKAETAEPKPAKAETAEPKPAEAKTTEPKPAEAKTTEPKPVKAKTAEPKSVKARGTKPKADKAADVSVKKTGAKE